MYEYTAKVDRVVDGDTVDLDVNLGFNIHMHERFRLFGINAPEVRGVEREAGLAAKEWLVERLSKVETLRVETIKDRKGKYGRWLAYLVDGDSAESINEEMVDAGHAKHVDY